MRLPSWSQCDAKLSAGEELTELEEFIHNNEPAGPQDREWRQHLSDVLAEAINEDRWMR